MTGPRYRPYPRQGRSTVASHGDTGQLILIRHGQTTWSRELKHTGRTDIPLTAAGEAAAARLAADLAARQVVAAFASPLQRAVKTAELAGLTTVPAGLKVDPGNRARPAGDRCLESARLGLTADEPPADPDGPAMRSGRPAAWWRRSGTRRGRARRHPARSGR